MGDLSVRDHRFHAAAGPLRRLVFIDNLRWSAISMVIVMHAAVTYSHLGSWYFYDSAGTGRAARIALGTYQSFQHAVAMGLLFGIAGYFARASVERKGVAAFVRERLFRLGLPLLLYMLVIGPLTECYVAHSWRAPRGFIAGYWHYIASGEVWSGSGPLWFCLVLLVFSFCFAVVRVLAPDWRRDRPAAVPEVGAFLGFAGVIAAVTFGVGLLAPRGGIVLNVDIHDFPQYPLMFAAGVAAQRSGWPLRLPSTAGRKWAATGLAFGALLWVLLIGLGGALQGNLSTYGGGWHWQAAGMDIWRSFTCLALTLGLITLYRERFNRHSRVSSFLTKSAFGVYVFHPPVLIAITRILREWPLDAMFKFAVASLLGIILTFLLVGVIARRTPGLRAII